MNDAHVYGVKQIHPQLDNIVQFRLSRNKIFFLGRNIDNGKWVKYLINILQHSTMLTILYLSYQGKVKAFATAIGAILGISSTSVSLMFLFRKEIFKTFLKTLKR